MTSRLRLAGDGKPRLFLFRGARIERDPELDERKLPTCTEEEFEGYIWDTRGGRTVKEEPVKENDHGMDALRYMVMDRDGRAAGMSWWRADDHPDWYLTEVERDQDQPNSGYSQQCG